MRFIDFWNDNDVRSIWIVTTGIPTGVTLTHDIDTFDEDYCDLGDFVYEQEWLNGLEGEVANSQWQWNGEGSPIYLSNSVLNVKVIKY